MVEVFISRIGYDASSETFVVILKEKAGSRVLPIWIGRPEAEAIVMRIHNIKHQRPLTHDLCKNLIDGLGARLSRVAITHVANNTFFAELELVVNGETRTIDARPSDGIAVALRMETPIFAADELLAEPDSDAEAGEPVETDRKNGEGSRLTAEELKAYLEKLRPEDFGDFKP